MTLTLRLTLNPDPIPDADSRVHDLCAAGVCANKIIDRFPAGTPGTNP